MVTEDIWDRERGFWLDGPAFFTAHMLSSAQMVCPDPVGILKGAEILDGLKSAPRWNAVDITERSDLSEGDTLVLAYRATGTRTGEPPYVAYCSSTYCRQGSAWKLISHQQTPFA